MRLSLLAMLGLVLLPVLASAAALPAEQVSFRETWSYADARQRPLRLGTGPTEGVWLDCFKDNDAWVLAAAHAQPAAKGVKLQPLAPPDAKVWDVGYMKCSAVGGSSSLWLPFGKHGLNRIQHAFSAPLPTSGAVSCQMWTPGLRNLRERGLTVVLQTPQGEGTVALGMWAGTTSPSYRISGIRKGVPGYDDTRYHRMPEISIADPNTANSSDVWHEFTIDIGAADPNELTFGYRAVGLPAARAQKKAKPLALVRGKDYLGIKAILVGALPGAIYTGKSDLGDDACFVGDVSLAGTGGRADTEFPPATASSSAGGADLDQHQADFEGFQLMCEVGNDFFSLCQQLGVSGKDISVSSLPDPLFTDLECMLELRTADGDSVDVAAALQQGTATIQFDPDGTCRLTVMSMNGVRRDDWVRAVPKVGGPPTTK